MGNKVGTENHIDYVVVTCPECRGKRIVDGTTQIDITVYDPMISLDPMISRVFEKQTCPTCNGIGKVLIDRKRLKVYEGDL